jgi:hypothetical protein
VRRRGRRSWPFFVSGVLGPAAFGSESYGPSRCVNAERPEALRGTGLVRGTQNVDSALPKVLREGLLLRLFGPRSMAVGGVPHDIGSGTVLGREATIFIAEDSCTAPDCVAVVFLVGTLPAPDPGLRPGDELNPAERLTHCASSDSLIC